MNWLVIAPAVDWRTTPLARILTPMQAFVQNAAASGVVLIGATIAALLLANSPAVTLYQRVLDTYLSISIGPWTLQETVLHWINDGLMALFFFLVGLELKREAIVGELARPRQALLPVLAALGGAVAPAILYFLLNRGGPGAAGWGVPMATDIAFALGVLALLGDRVPWTLKVFLTAIAVIDDLLAVLIIALFYSSGIKLGALGLGLGLLMVLSLINLLGIRKVLPYVLIGVLVWLAFLYSGIHATIAGVLVALTIPARQRMNVAHFVQQAEQLIRQIEQGPPGSPPMLTDERQQHALLELEDACEAVQAPLQKLEHQLHPWVAFGIVPLFALANAGVSLSLSGLTGTTLPVTAGIVLGLVIGKPVGLVGITWLVVRSGKAALPHGVTWRQIVGVGCLAGLGFTMSLFIAMLGLTDPALLEAAKLGILTASLLAGVAGFLVLR
jgi:NhaA family Na+:H+ antiporter